MEKTLDNDLTPPNRSLGQQSETQGSTEKTDRSERIPDPEQREIDDGYRTLSRPAIFSVVFGLGSFLGFLFPFALVFCVIGVGLGLVALWGIRKYPDELSGAAAAKFGIGLCAVVLTGGSSLHTYIYLTEVPPNHERLTFYEIEAPKRQKYSPTEKALEMDGKQVFIKGYTFPGKSRKNLSRFLLVGDFGMCCFGGDPQPTHTVRVTIKNGQKIDYSTRVRKLSGTFRVLDHLGRNDEGKGYIYELEADSIK